MATRRISWESKELLTRAATICTCRRWAWKRHSCRRATRRAGPSGNRVARAADTSGAADPGGGAWFKAVSQGVSQSKARVGRASLSVSIPAIKDWPSSSQIPQIRLAESKIGAYGPQIGSVAHRKRSDMRLQLILSQPNEKSIRPVDSALSGSTTTALPLRAGAGQEEVLGRRARAKRLHVARGPVLHSRRGRAESAAGPAPIVWRYSRLPGRAPGPAGGAWWCSGWGLRTPAFAR